MEWSAWYHNFNRNQLESFNIFNHGGFTRYAKERFVESETKEEFAEGLRRELQYYFWSKCEYELVITNVDGRIIMTPWVGRRESVSLDVTDDENFDWVDFYEWIAYQKYARDGSIKIDVYDQVRYRWSEFVDYCWGNLMN